MTRLLSVALVMLAALAPAVARAQVAPPRDTLTQPTIGTGVVAGRVVGDDGRPIRRARLSITGETQGSNRSTAADDEGRFVFPDLPPGRYALSASKPAYLNVQYGAKRVGRPGTPIVLAKGAQVNDLTIKMPRGGVVTGRILGPNGEPSVGTQVRLMQYRWQPGGKTLQTAGGVPGSTQVTDDRGIYRIFGLTPGEYYIAATPRNTSMNQSVFEVLQAEIERATKELQQPKPPVPTVAAPTAPVGRGFTMTGGLTITSGMTTTQVGGRGTLNTTRPPPPPPLAGEDGPTVTFAQVFYPGTALASTASPIVVAAGEERTGIDWQLQLVPAARIDVVVQGPNGVPQETQVTLSPGIQAGGLNSTMGTSVREGKATFSGVAPGQYRISARVNERIEPGGEMTGPPAMALWALADVDVNGVNLSGIQLDLGPGMTLSGRVVFEGAALAAGTRVRVNLIPLPGQQNPIQGGGSSPSTLAAEDGTFRLIGVTPGKFTLTASATAPSAAAPSMPGSGWMLKSVVVDGRETFDTGVEIVPGQNVNEAVLTLTSRTTEISGVLQDGSGRPLTEYSLVLFTTDRTLWGSAVTRRVTTARPSTETGKFTFRNLPPGEYFLAALTDLESGEWYDPAFLEQLMPAAIKMTLAEGEKKVQDIKIAGTAANPAPLPHFWIS